MPPSYADRLITLDDGRVDYDGPARGRRRALSRAVLSYTLQGLAAHRLRSVGMALAVFLGVALVSGTYILTDTINRSFDDIFEQALEGTDVVVTPKELVRQEQEEPPPFDARVLERVRDVPGVESAAGSVGALVRLVDDDNDQLGNGFAPNFVFSVLPEPFVPVTYTEGRAPRNAREVALDEGTAERSDLGIGDRVGVAGDTSRDPLPDRRHQPARRHVGRRLGLGHAHPARGPARDRPPRQVRPDLDRGGARREPGRTSGGASSACCRRTAAGGDRGAERRPRGRRDRLRPVVPHDRPAGARRA